MDAENLLPTPSVGSKVQPANNTHRIYGCTHGDISRLPPWGVTTLAATHSTGVALPMVPSRRPKSSELFTGVIPVKKVPKSKAIQSSPVVSYSYIWGFLKSGTPQNGCFILQMVNIWKTRIQLYNMESPPREFVPRALQWCGVEVFHDLMPGMQQLCSRGRHLLRCGSVHSPSPISN